MPEEVVVVGILVASEGRADALLDTLKRCAGPTRAEAGCWRYDFHRDNTDSNRLVAIERWRSQDDLELHRASPHVAELSAGLGSPGLLAARPLLVYTTPVDTADVTPPL